jgi:hypothetical protein
MIFCDPKGVVERKEKVVDARSHFMYARPGALAYMHVITATPNRV